jgi:protein-disulfide isomerase
VFLGEESVWAAEASECAADQDAFWPYHDLIFARHRGANRGGYSIENLKAYAGELGLDQTVFDQCLDSGKYTQLVSEQTTAAQQIGVRSTPSFVVNGQPVVGAQGFEVFKELIEQQLSNH